MSIYSNRAGEAAEQADAYIAAVLQLVEGHDALTVLEGTPSFVAEVIESTPVEALSTPERVGKWSMAGVVAHLADSELVWGWRLRLTLAEESPRITGFDQDRWADRLGYDEADPVEALDLFRVLRDSSLRLLARATPEDLERVGVHDERGEESVAHMIRLYAGHDLVHRNQLRRIRGAVLGEGS